MWRRREWWGIEIHSFIHFLGKYFWAPNVWCILSMLTLYYFALGQDSSSQRTIQNAIFEFDHKRKKWILNLGRSGEHFVFCCVDGSKSWKLTHTFLLPFLCYLPVNLQISIFTYWIFICYRGPFGQLVFVWSLFRFTHLSLIYMSF